MDTIFTGKMQVSFLVWNTLNGNPPKKRSGRKSKIGMKWSEKPAHYVNGIDGKKTICGISKERADNVYYEENHFLGIPAGSDSKPRCKRCLRSIGRGTITGKTTGINLIFYPS